MKRKIISVWHKQVLHSQNGNKECLPLLTIFVGGSRSLGGLFAFDLFEGPTRVIIIRILRSRLIPLSAGTHLHFGKLGTQGLGAFDLYQLCLLS